MKITLTAPSKTFLLGEYAALAGCPSLILNTAPLFELHISEQNYFSYHGIQTLSPAGRFIQNHLQQFKNCRLEFIDPHAKLGGFGASSAQFLLVYKLYLAFCKQPETLLELSNSFTHADNINTKEFENFILPMLRTYQRYAWNGKGLPPSGADIVGQHYGRLTWYAKNVSKVEVFAWPFPELSIVLLRTGEKIATHEHLSQLSRIPAKPFTEILNKAYAALHSKNQHSFIQVVNDYGKILKDLNFVAPNTQKLLDKLNQLPYMLAAKGCGALGADIVVSIIPDSYLNDFTNWLTEQTISYILRSADNFTRT